MAYVKLVHAGHFLCHVRHHILTVYKRSDITSDKVSYIKPAHAGHFQFYVRHVPRVPHIWRTLVLVLGISKMGSRDVIMQQCGEKKNSLASKNVGIYIHDFHVNVIPDRSV